MPSRDRAPTATAKCLGDGWPREMARPAHKPDPTIRRQVEAMAGYGVPETDIAGVIGIDPKTL